MGSMAGTPTQVLIKGCNIIDATFTEGNSTSGFAA